jgi:DNA-binding TFAR19-related protein (PDSD5 family)
MEDIEDIRRRKMRQMERRFQARKLQDEQKQTERHEIDRILDQVLKPDAVEYLNGLRSTDGVVAGKIEEIVISLAIQRRIRYKIDKVIIRAIERKVKGVEPTISFVRKGKKVEISEKLKDAD